MSVDKDLIEKALEKATEEEKKQIPTDEELEKEDKTFEDEAEELKDLLMSSKKGSK